MAVADMFLALIPRIRRILFNPKEEWVVIAGETTGSGAIWTGYVIPLAALSALAGLVGGLVFGSPLGSVMGGALGISFGMRYYVQIAVGGFVGSIIGVALVAWLVGALAPTFGAKCEGNTGLKVAAYSYTAALVAGLFAIIPMLSVLGILGLYSIYLLFLGLKALTGVSEEKAIPYTATIFVAGLVVSLAVGALFGRLL
ncbi:MAG: Yip1 family protein [Gemmatimonadota bacterium]